MSQRRSRLPDEQVLIGRLRDTDSTLIVVTYFHPIIVERLKAKRNGLTAGVIVTLLSEAIETYSGTRAYLSTPVREAWLRRYLNCVIRDRQVLREALRLSTQGHARR